MNEKTVLDIEYVKRAMNGDEEAFKEIYNITYYNKLFIAKKYMKNDTAAEDVLQEAYIKIWKYLPSLDDPANFSAWSSKIVANTALNELRKNQPMPFTDLAAEGDDGSEMFFDVEDSYELNQPELAYTEQEEQNIVREMIEALSDEQRMCIMMYYIEELSVKEIAEALGCSEGTVKSRLNYGRKNIKLRAEDMQKRGYNFKGISALALLLFLIKKQAVNSYAAPIAVTSSGASQGTVGGAPANMNMAGAVGKNVVKKAFLKTVAGRVVLGIAAAAIVGGTTAAIILANKDDDEKKKNVTNDITTEVVVDTTEYSSEVTITEVTETTEATTEVTTEATTAETTETTTEVTTETTTETTTEATTEAAQTIDPSYVTAYAEVLEEYGAAILTHEKADDQYDRKSGKTVAIFDAFGDPTPELIFLSTTELSSEQEVSADINIFTMMDGKAVKVTSGTYSVVAGSGQSNIVYAAKSKDAVFWCYIPSHGICSYSVIIEKIGYDYLKNEAVEQQIIKNDSWPDETEGSNEDAHTYTYQLDGKDIDEATYTAVKQEWEADYGDVVIENHSSTYSEQDREARGYLYSYDEAVAKLEELKNSEGE